MTHVLSRIAEVSRWCSIYYRINFIGELFLMSWQSMRKILIKNEYYTRYALPFDAVFVALGVTMPA